jgi:hypothetical protein
MFTNVNLSAPIGAVALLGTGFIFLLAGLAFVYTLIKRKFGANKLVLAVAAGIAVIYLGVMLLFAFNSSEKTLARGQEKHFCEIDCHLAYSVVNVTESETLGDAPNQATAAGTFRVVTIKTRFDENTISPTRGNALLYPNSRVITVIDDNGQQYLPSPAGQRALGQNKTAGTPITTPLRPGESYTTTLVFDLPKDSRNPALLINEGEWITHFVIGHENSPFHKRTKLLL